MLPTALLVFREVLEAALVMGIIAVAIKGAANIPRYMILGLLLGLAGAMGIAYFADKISDLAEGMGQELFNALILFSAVALLSWHNIWMQKHGRELAAKIKNVGQLVVQGQRPMYLVSMVIALTIFREGSELVLFMHGLVAAQGTAAWPMLLGGIIGLAGGAALGFALYFGLLRIPNRILFQTTSWLILLLTAGLAAQGARYLVQADILPSLGSAVWDTSWILSETSMIGVTLHTLIGYVARPDGIQIVFYGATLLLLGGYMFANQRPSWQKPAKVLASAVLLMIVSLAIIPSAKAVEKVYSPNVELRELEIEFREHYTQDKVNAKDNQRKGKYEVGYAFTDKWFSSIYFEFEKEANGDYEHEATAWENIIQLTEQGQYWMDYGLYIELEHPNDGDSNKAELKLLLEKTWSRFTHTANLITETHFGGTANSEVELGYAWKSAYRWKPSFTPALELYGSFGETDNLQFVNQKVGPVVSGSFKISNKSSIAYEAGYLLGTDGATSDGTMKFLLEWETYF